MKKGDKLRLDIEGTPVGHAEIEHVGEEQVTIFIPAQRVIAQKRTTLDLTPETHEPEVQTIVEGVDRIEPSQTNAENITSEAVEAPVSASNNNTAQGPSEVSAEAPGPSVPAPVEVVEPPAATSEEVSGDTTRSE